MKLSLSGIAWALAVVPAFSAYAETFRFGVIGDAGRETKGSASVRESLEAAQIRTLVLPGDNLYLTQKDTYESVWNPWRDRGFLFDVVAIGNHHLSYDAERKYFGMPAEYYAKVYGDTVRFLVLNSDNVKTGVEQAEWLDAQLEAASEPFIFPVFHHPSYSVSSFHKPAERAAFHAAVRPVIAKHRAKITALLLGHDHLATLLHFDDLPAIVSGAVYESRRDVGTDHVEDGVRVKSAWIYDFKPHWLRLEIESGNKEARFAFVKADKSGDACNFRVKTGSRAALDKNCDVGRMAARPPVQP